MPKVITGPLGVATIHGKQVNIRFNENGNKIFTANSKKEAIGRAKVDIGLLISFESSGIIWQLGKILYRLDDGTNAIVE